VSDLRDLYQEVILDHGKAPRNFHAIDRPDARAEGYNPLCGDRVQVFVRLDGARIADVAFLGDGCAISKASASMMTGSVKGKTKAETDQLFHDFHALVTAGATPAGTSGADDAAARLGKLAVFGGVHEFPARVKCASLAWHTLQAALAGKQEPVSTEAEG
jgi:nitrogen fixation NifU-like protein